MELVTDGTPSTSISQTAVSQIPNLDPTLVKAMTIQETSGGTDKSFNGTKDVMQVNNGANNFADWDAHLSKYGLEHFTVPGPEKSINAGIMELATKGFHGQSTITGFMFQDWDSAVQNYNGGGAANYRQSVIQMYNSAQTPSPSNYVKPVKQ